MATAAGGVARPNRHDQEALSVRWWGFFFYAAETETNACHHTAPVRKRKKPERRYRESIAGTPKGVGRGAMPGAIGPPRTPDTNNCRQKRQPHPPTALTIIRTLRVFHLRSGHHPFGSFAFCPNQPDHLLPYRLGQRRPSVDDGHQVGIGYGRKCARLGRNRPKARLDLVRLGTQPLDFPRNSRLFQILSPPLSKRVTSAFRRQPSLAFLVVREASLLRAFRVSSKNRRWPHLRCQTKLPAGMCRIDKVGGRFA